MATILNGVLAPDFNLKIGFCCEQNLKMTINNGGIGKLLTKK